MKTTSKLDMLKQIFEDAEIPFIFLGNKAILQMRNDLVAEVMLNRGDTHGKYTGLKATILHKQNGEITSNVFFFEQYLGKDADRTHPNASHVKNMYLWENNGLDWYVVRPKDTTNILDAIFEYAMLYARD